MRESAYRHPSIRKASCDFELRGPGESLDQGLALPLSGSWRDLWPNKREVHIDCLGGGTKASLADDARTRAGVARPDRIDKRLGNQHRAMGGWMEMMIFAVIF